MSFSTYSASSSLKRRKRKSSLCLQLLQPLTSVTIVCGGHKREDRYIRKLKKAFHIHEKIIGRARIWSFPIFFFPKRTFNSSDKLRNFFYFTREYYTVGWKDLWHTCTLSFLEGSTTVFISDPSFLPCVRSFIFTFLHSWC